MSSLRVVSLLPAATEIVCALGLRANLTERGSAASHPPGPPARLRRSESGSTASLVGRSHECDFPTDVAELPALTRARVDSSLPSERLDAQVREIVAAGLPLYELDEARLAELRPDLVVTQEACEVCAVSYEQVACTLERLPGTARIVSLKPAFLGDLFRDVREVAEACGVDALGERLARSLAARVEAVRRTAGAHRPRVAVVEWLAPPMLAGHWTPELVEAAGGEPLGPEPGAPSPYASWSEIQALRPDVVVVAACGMDLQRTRQESAAHAERLRELAPRVLLLDGNAYVNRPGPRLVDAIETLAAFLRGEPVPADRGLRLD